MSLSELWSSHGTQNGPSSGVHAAEMASTDTESVTTVTSKRTERQVPRQWALGRSSCSSTFESRPLKIITAICAWYFLLSMLFFTLAHPLSLPPFVISVRRQAPIVPSLQLRPQQLRPAPITELMTSPLQECRGPPGRGLVCSPKRPGSPAPFGG